jgi:hypothetical protein
VSVCVCVCVYYRYACTGRRPALLFALLWDACLLARGRAHVYVRVCTCCAVLCVCILQEEGDGTKRRAGGRQERDVLLRARTYRSLPCICMPATRVQYEFVYLVEGPGSLPGNDAWSHNVAHTCSLVTYHTGKVGPDTHPPARSLTRLLTTETP